MYKISALIFISLVIITSCKKGDEDPFISLRTREARLKNTWVLQSASSSSMEKYKDGSIITVNEEYDGTKATVTRTTPDEYTVTEVYYTLEYRFLKQHNYKSKYAETNPLEPEYYFEINEDGRWEFLSRSKSDGIKNKEQLVLMPAWRYNDVEVVDTDYPYETWTLVKLSNEELKVKIEVENSASLSDYEYSREAEYVFKSL